MRGMIGMNTDELGADASRRGLSIDTNPFRDETKEATEFNIGWRREQKKIQEAAIKNYKHAKRMRPNF